MFLNTPLYVRSSKNEVRIVLIPKFCDVDGHRRFCELSDNYFHDLQILEKCMFRWFEIAVFTTSRLKVVDVKAVSNVHGRITVFTRNAEHAPFKLHVKASRTLAEKVVVSQQMLLSEIQSVINQLACELYSETPN